LLDVVGHGGMGVVYRALDDRREVALKLLKRAERDELDRLSEEFELLAEIEHANCVRPYELFLGSCDAFFTMELVEGVDLATFARRAGTNRIRDEGRLCGAARQLASAIRAVHAAGVLHRDIKPSNVLVSSEGQVVLIDFGLAERLHGAARETKGSGALLGTHGYVSPEQAFGESLGTASDWYAFGVTLFEVTAGRLPFSNAFQALGARRRVDVRPSMRRHAPWVPKELDELVAELLHPNPHRRPSGEDVVRVLDSIRC
jgi:serine/threonine protein kinase